MLNSVKCFFTGCPPSDGPLSESQPLNSTRYGSTNSDNNNISSSNNEEPRAAVLQEGHLHEEEGKVTPLELFSDLAIVVAIHIAAEPLEEAGGSNDLAWYIVRVFMLWLTWSGDMMFMNAGVLFRRADCPLHYAVVFVWMGLVLHMTQAFARDDNVTAVIIFLVTRAIELFSYAGQVSEAIPNFISGERINNMRSFVPFMVSTYVLCELLPLSIAIAFRVGNNRDLYNPAVAFFVLSTIVANILSAVISDNRSGGKIMENTFATDHLHERYELVTLIFIGEICFAAGKSGGTDDLHRLTVTTCALMEAFGAYLLVFTTRHGAGSTEFWKRSAKHMVVGMLLFAGLFCAIPGLGSGFVRIMDPEGDEGEEEEPEDETGNEHSAMHDHTTCDVGSANLLCFSTFAFLVISAMINLLDWTPSLPDFKRIGIMGRVWTRCSLALLVFLLPFAPHWLACSSDLPSATFLCPMAALLSAMIEGWAVGSFKWAPMDFHKDLRFSVQ